MISDVILSWDESVAYDAEDVVNHDGYLWTAKYWTQGNEPGTGDDSPWEQTGELDCD